MHSRGENKKREDLESDDKKPATAPGWMTQNQFNELPRDVREAIAKREKEIEAGQAKYKQYAEYDKVLTAPRLQWIKQMGVSPAQAIHNLYTYMEGLADEA
jgi:hypothetical protein